jgi:hypothetical protein
MVKKQRWRDGGISLVMLGIRPRWLKWFILAQLMKDGQQDII